MGKLLWSLLKNTCLLSVRLLSRALVNLTSFKAGDKLALFDLKEQEYDPDEDDHSYFLGHHS